MSNKINISTDQMMTERIARIVKAVLQTPSPENCQPWKISVRENVIEVFHSSKRAKLGMLPDYVSVVGLGMVAEGLELASKTEGLQARITYFLERRSDKSPWLRAELNPADIPPDPLEQGLFMRHSDRRRYAGGSLDDPVFHEVRREADAIQGVNLYFINEYPDDYLRLLRNADQIMMALSEVRRDFTKWLRFTDKEIKRTRDGINWRTLLRGPKNWVYYMRSRIWWLSARLDWFPSWLMKLETIFFDDSGRSPSRYDDGAGIGCITVTSETMENLAESGRLALRIWLLLNLRGYSFQPMCNLGESVYSQRVGKPYLPGHMSHLLANGYETLQRIFSFSDNELPLFFFRTGLPMCEYPENARALRRKDLFIMKRKV